MNQKSTPAKQTSRGRPPEFDADAVINGAVGLFWEKGFEGTSLRDISETLGIKSSTLYNSFGGKDGIYASAVESYLAIADRLFFAPLRDGVAGLDDLVALLERQRLSITSSIEPAGCLLVNAMVTGETPETVDRYRAQFRLAIQCALERAVDLGEIASADTSRLGATLLGGIVGASVSAKAGSSKAELNDILDGLIHTVQTWGIEPRPRPASNTAPTL